MAVPLEARPSRWEQSWPERAIQSFWRERHLVLVTLLFAVLIVVALFLPSWLLG
jgi:hypothetical protein